MDEKIQLFLNDIKTKKTQIEEVNNRNKSLKEIVDASISYKCEIEGIYNNLNDQLSALKEESAYITSEKARISDSLEVLFFKVDYNEFLKV